MATVGGVKEPPPTYRPVNRVSARGECVHTPQVEYARHGAWRVTLRARGVVHCTPSRLPTAESGP